jgi:hypothetical protein
MRTFIQLRNGVGYATIITPSDVPDHTVTPDHTTAIEVFTAEPDQFLKKRYDEETKTWSDAPIIYWAEINQNGMLTEIHRTVFLDEIPDNGVVMPDYVDGSYKYINGEWIAPVIHIPNEYTSNNVELLASYGIVLESPPREEPPVPREQSVEETPTEEATN